MVDKSGFLFREISHVTKIWKTTFLKEFFNEIRLKVGAKNLTFDLSFTNYIRNYVVDRLNYAFSESL